MKPKVSIIVPVYNVENYIDRCLNSLVNQTLKDIEIILVDDESPDNCPGICDEWAEKDNRIIVIHKKNEGAGLARNSGLEIASGEYIGFVDSDDYARNTMFEDLYNHISSDNVDCVLGSWSYDFGEGKIEKKTIPGFPDANEKKISAKDFITGMIGTLPYEKHNQLYGLSIWKGLFSAKIINQFKIRFESERLYGTEEPMFYISFMSKARSVLLTSESYYFYCYNSDSLTHNYDPNRILNEIVLMKRIRNRFQYFNIDSFELRLDRLLLMRMLSSISEAVKLLPFTKALKEVKTIANNIELQKMLRLYPINKMPLAEKLFFTLVKLKFITMLVVLYSIKINSSSFFSRS